MPQKATANEHDYLRRFVDPVLMPLIESLLLYQPESIYEFIHDYVDESKSARFKSHPHASGYAKKLASRRKMVDFMSTSVIPVMDDLAHQILREKPSSVQSKYHSRNSYTAWLTRSSEALISFYCYLEYSDFIKDVVAARIIVGSSSPFDVTYNQQEAIEYRVNDQVLCRYKGRPRYYSGVISAVHPEDDSFTVVYSDGRTEQHVHRMCLKPAVEQDSESNRGDNNNQKKNNSSTDGDATTEATTASPARLRSIEIVILIIGIDGAGKTTLLSALQGDLDKEHVPSAGFTSATFQTETGSATFYDLGGGPAFRNVWKEYYADAHAVMFIVDSSSENIVHQSAAILQDSMTHTLMATKPLLVFANKRDQPSALAEDELTRLLQLKQLPNSRLVPCVAKPGAFSNMVDDRLEQGLHWLFEQVDKNYDALNDRVQADLAVKKAKDQQRRAEQRARVSAWREEREQREMALHDKPSLAPHDESEVGSGTTTMDQQQTGGATKAQRQEEQSEEAVIYCSNCTSQPAVTKCAASKWMPVCAACATELRSSR